MRIPEIGIEMRKFRKKHGYSQEYLARKLNVSVQSISSYELGKRTPNMAVIIRFAALTDTAIPELMFFEKIKHKLKEPAFEMMLKNFETVSYKKFLELSDNQRSSVIQEQLDRVSRMAKNSPFHKS